MESMLHEKIFRDVMYHPAVVPIIKDLCGDNFRLDHLNIHTHVGPGFKGGGLHGGHHPGSGSGFYELLNGSRFLNGLISVTYELYDTHCNDGGFCCIPGLFSTVAATARAPTQTDSGGCYAREQARTRQGSACQTAGVTCPRECMTLSIVFLQPLAIASFLRRCATSALAQPCAHA